MLGICERNNGTYAYLRDEAWRRIFVAPDDCFDHCLPQDGERVEFTLDTTDTRGPRARELQIIAAPAPRIERTCNDCGERYELDANQQAWFDAKRLLYPTRCEPCRKTRKRW